jgi:membrane-bound inhibitor of C-type lysozyme
MPGTLTQLREACDEIAAQAYENGEGDLDVVYVDVRDLTLVKEVLSDGSTVLNLIVRENR